MINKLMPEDEGITSKLLKEEKEEDEGQDN